MSGAKLQGKLNFEMETSWATSEGFGQDKIGTDVSPAVRGEGTSSNPKRKPYGNGNCEEAQTARDGGGLDSM